MLSVCAYVDLPLQSDIHFLRFPVAIRPAGQLNNGLFLPCFLLNSCALVRVCVIEQSRSSPTCTVTQQALDCPVAGF